ncbi:MAG: VIT1/CCC1 transporter family protein [Mesorhizobium sp.]|nr:VIT1/CCC1 transporter family protein [Mesorhizobium sp.]MBL8579873.1 VIT1/CCC1 transporter family protein [Mesorhizobium sp.]
MDEAIVRKWVLNANDGIISTTGIIQGFAGAGAHENMVLFAALAVMVTGGLASGGAVFAEATQDRAAELEIIAEERRQLALSPQEQHDELREHYQRHGLDIELAERVAAALMRKDALAAQLETEHGILDEPPPATRPWVAALRGVFGFISGALPITLAVVFVPDQFRLPVALLVVLISLTATGLVAARAGGGHPMRTVSRSIAIGLFIGSLSFLAGNVFDLLDQLMPQIEIEIDEIPGDGVG